MNHLTPVGHMPDFVSAHVALKPRQELKDLPPWSIEYLQATTPTDAVRRHVVTLLKKWGFKVISESARDIHISGPLHLFESVFSTTLAESPPYWKWRKSPSIPKEFADEVANVILPEAVDHCHE